MLGEVLECFVDFLFLSKLVIGTDGTSTSRNLIRPACPMRPDTPPVGCILVGTHGELGAENAIHVASENPVVRSRPHRSMEAA